MIWEMDEQTDRHDSPLCS